VADVEWKRAVQKVGLQIPSVENQAQGLYAPRSRPAVKGSDLTASINSPNSVKSCPASHAESTRETVLARQALVRLAGGWNWAKEAEELLWAIAQQDPDGQWALELLARAFRLGGDTRALLRVFQLAVTARPEDAVAKNNLAAVSLLLRTNLDQAHELAREGFCIEPGLCASTYAFSLHLRGQTSDALHVLRSSSEVERQRPATAAYYGVILAAAGDLAAAEPYLALAEQGDLLPEECLMLQAARRLLP
jgi:hypothetical protein